MFSKVFFVFLVFSVFVFAGPRILSAELLPWLSDLSINDQGADVKRLQEYLNQDPKTRLAGSGPGSPGKETEYFGSLTRQAVIRFQNIYAEEILYPVGLTQGTGVVGPQTRKFLNNQIKSDSSVPEEGREDPVFEPPPVLKKSLSEDLGADEKDQKENLTEQEDLESLSSAVDLEIEEKETGPGSATLDSLEPKSGSPGDKVKIFGEDFAEEGNIVYTGVKVFQDVPSLDGKSLEFKLPELETENTSDRSFSSPVWIYVNNGQGVSNRLIFDLVI